MKNEKYAALIAVRKGSKRVPLKNIRDFCGTSLLEIKVKQALSCNLIDKVYVSSDSDQMLNIASGLGAISIKRPDNYCTDSVPMNDVYEHLALSINTDHIVYLHVTSPLLKNETLDNAIRTYQLLPHSNHRYDSLATVEVLKKYIWFNNKPINYDPSRHPRSQDLPDYYSLNFAINIISRKLMIERKNILGEKIYPFFLNELESIDVDTEHDFTVAKALYSSLGDS